METRRLPESIEQIAQKAEAGAAGLARSAVVLGYELLSKLIEDAKLSIQASVRNVPEPQVNTSSNQGRFLSVEEAAEFLRLKPSTLYAWVSKEKVPYSKAGSRILFEREALVEFVKTREGRKEKPHKEDSQTPLRMLK